MAVSEPTREQIRRLQNVRDGVAGPDEGLIQHRGDLRALLEEVERLARLARLAGALNRVLTEAGLHAHKVGCPNRLKRPAKWDEALACAACLAEDELALAAAQPEKDK